MPGVLYTSTAFSYLCLLNAVSLSEVSVDSVRPLYGPAAGGTRLTIAGQFLGVSTVTLVHIGDYKQYPDKNRSSTATYLTRLSEWACLVILLLVSHELYITAFR